MSTTPSPPPVQSAPAGSEPPSRRPAVTAAVTQVQQGQSRYITVMFGVAVTLGALVLLRQFSGFVGPFFLALNLVIAAYPIHTWLRGKGTPGWLSASVMVLAVVVILLAAVFGLTWAISAMVAELPNHSDQYFALYDQVMALLRHYEINTAGFGDFLQQISPGSLVNVLTQAFSATMAVMVVVVTIIASLVFLAMDTPGMRSRIKAASADYPTLGRGLATFTNQVRRYWVTTTIFGAIIAILDGAALFILGVPLAAVWALLSFLTNYIPNIGFVIGLVPPALLGLLTGGWKIALAVVVIYSVLNFVIQSIIQPRIVGETVGVAPTVSFVSLLIWGWVLGAIGTLVALPMTLLLIALLVDNDPKAKWAKALLSVRTGRK